MSPRDAPSVIVDRVQSDRYLRVKVVQQPGVMRPLGLCAPAEDVRSGRVLHRGNGDGKTTEEWAAAWVS